MNTQDYGAHLIALVGAGPAGLYAAKKLLETGTHVVLFNRDIKPGGLAEYGIFPTKHKMKDGLRKQFRKILAHPNVDYYGDFSVGEKGEVTFQELHALGFDAFIIAAGAQGTKNLGIEGEESIGVLHAKDVVYHYNHLPPFSQQRLPIGKRVAIVGMGNVMIDIAHYLLRLYRQVEEVIVVARRGPAERKYDAKEYRYVEPCVDQAALRHEIERVRATIETVGQNATDVMTGMTTDKALEQPADCPGRMTFRFLASPQRVLADEDGKVRALEVEENTLVERDGRISPRGTGTMVELPVDTVIFAIGDRVDESLGLPYNRGEFVTTPSDHATDAELAPYHVYDPDKQQNLEHTYVVGWSRKASDGLVGKARQDAETGVQAICKALEHIPLSPVATVEERRHTIRRFVAERANVLITKEEIALLEQAEQRIAKERGLDEFKFDRNDDMREAIDRQKSA